MTPAARALIRGLCAFVPKSKIYKVPFALSRPMMASRLWASSAAAQNTWLDKSIEKWYVQRLFRLFNSAGVMYPVEYAVEASGDIVKAYEQSKRLIICSGHFLLNMFAYRYLLEKGIPICSIANAQYVNSDGHEVTAWGSPERLSVIANSAGSLGRAREFLNQGTAVTVYIESKTQYAGGIAHQFGREVMYLYPNIFRFAEATKAPVFFVGVTFSNSSDITVHISPFSGVCPTGKQGVADCLAEHAEFLRKMLEISRD